jgi:hypothetical protein
MSFARRPATMALAHISLFAARLDFSLDFSRFLHLVSVRALRRGENWARAAN